MFTVQFLDHKEIVLSQLLRKVPLVNEELKIKGRKGKIVNVVKVDQTKFHIHMIFETKKKPTVLIDFDNKRK
ncbi:hypothetical protein [Rummeliibacillus pycnus]|uniref:hypothetical protein n=1 Tax=Rummeliibacillus pycnus TaxID=101070 RepID=UPI000C9A39D1|nr:hypothetical protein [Rummeliibacillus pycnus]